MRNLRCVFTFISVMILGCLLQGCTTTEINPEDLEESLHQTESWIQKNLW